MAFPDLPRSVKSMLADERMRTHHHLWHFVRSRESWNGLSPANRDALVNEGWESPRFEQDAGSGIDFLGMHRQMIQMTNDALASADDADWPSVTGWDPIPWDETDADWPVPRWPASAPPGTPPRQWREWTSIVTDMRSDRTTREMRRLADQFQDPDYLTSVSVDELGTAMEWSIHGWMHIRWSGAPHAEPFSTGVNNDWLFLPWSSHVNKVFWKLHGWIDARIGDWEQANAQTAELSNAWSGPESGPVHTAHMASVGLLDHLPSRHTVPLPMSVDREVVARLLA